MIRRYRITEVECERDYHTIDNWAVLDGWRGDRDATARLMRVVFGRSAPASISLTCYEARRLAQLGNKRNLVFVSVVSAISLGVVLWSLIC